MATRKNAPGRAKAKPYRKKSAKTEAKSRASFIRAARKHRGIYFGKG